MTDKTRAVRAWPLVLIGLSAGVSVWGGWVGLGALAGFGVVHPFPGIAPHVRLNLSITLPVTMEAYGAYALGAWLSPRVPAAARRFAGFSALGALALGMSGQAAYHLLAADHASKAPWPVIVAVSCVPVVTLGFAAALTHLLRAGGEAGSEQSSPHEIAKLAAPLVTALAARISPVRGTAQGTPDGIAQGIPEGITDGTVQVTAQGTSQGTDDSSARDTTRGTSRATKPAPDKSEWPSARGMDDADLLKRTKAAVRQWERTHQPGEKLPASYLADALKIRIGRDRAAELLAEVYKPHLVKTAEGE